MLVHKQKTRTVHKTIQPWEKKYQSAKSTPATHTWESPLARKEYKAVSDASSFSIMAYWSLHGTKWSPEDIFTEWWFKAFDSLPEDEHNTVEYLYKKIALKLLQDGYIYQGIEYTGSRSDIEHPDWLCGAISNTYIHINKEHKMKSLKRKKKSTSTGRIDPVVPPGTRPPRMTKKRKATIFLLEKMLEQEYTDVELRALVNEEIGYDFTKSRIERRRNSLNDGDMLDFGFPQPDEEIHEITEAAGDVSTPSKSTKRPPVKPAKKKVTGREKSIPTLSKGKKKFLAGSKKKKFSFKRK